MTKELIIINLINNYGKYGVTEEMLNQLIDNGLINGLNLDAIYLMLRMTLAMEFGEHEYATVEEVAAAMEVSVENVNEMVEQSRKDLIEAGENPDKYFIRAESSRYMM